MNADQLIGKVAARYLRELVTSDDGDGVARFLLDCLTPGQTAAIAQAILSDNAIKDLIDIKLPMNFVGDYDLPEAILTRERTTYFRNATCPKPALLLANTGDDEEQSLKELIPIDSSTLISQHHLWIDCVSAELPITDQHKEWWVKAIQALNRVQLFSIDRLANYILQTRTEIMDGSPILCALGAALPAIHSPKDSALFTGLSEKTASTLIKWKKLYNQTLKKRACYLVKQSPTYTLLLEETLNNSFQKVKEDIPDEIHPIITAFISAESGWNTQAAELAEQEWDIIKPIFDGLKREKFNLGKATLDYYDERESDLLTEDELDYLGRLSKYKRSDPQEEDEEFYHNHRNELKEFPFLKGKWDRYIFGTPIESEDFIVGIAKCLHRLFDQNSFSSNRQLTIICDRSTKRELRDLNNDAGFYFARRYRGLPTLFGNRVHWEIGHIMDYEDLDSTWRKASKPYVNRSIAKAALQLKFQIELEYSLPNGDKEKVSKQLIWKYNPNGINSEFSKDWNRVSKHPLVKCQVNREPIPGKGRYESLDLRNVRTLYAAFGQDRGSLVSTYDKDNDIAFSWPVNLEFVEQQGLVSNEVASRINGLYSEFLNSYTSALVGFLEEGLGCKSLIKQAEHYGVLLEKICKFAQGDKNREYLLRPLLDIGTVTVNGNHVTSIIAPWHPLRLAAMSVKALQVGSLMRHLLSNNNVSFGDSQLYFKELEKELLHPYYPEIAIGWREKKPVLLSISDYFLDYSLHESPVSDNEFDEETNDNPIETANLIIDLAKRFLTLYPHEKANFSVVLYNCDSARLPYTLVDKMGEFHDDEEELRCQIILRHRNKAKLRDLYEQIIDSPDADVDSFVSSETAKDFMARLRIGIMADQAPVPNPEDGPPADLVFLQDVIARHSEIDWFYESYEPVDQLSFIPARWSRRRPSAMDDMKSIVYLCSPVQTSFGWSYITALTSFFKNDVLGNKDERLIPARKLDFNDPETSSIFKEVHNLGNWVVNYDELLDRRQLLNQQVNIIRFKKGPTQGRNVLISSTASLTLLLSLVNGRLKHLNLGLSDTEYYDLSQKLIDEANEISGDIVLRAAKRGRNASELIGLVLSRYLISHEMGNNNRFGWYFLDDYAEWLGQREGRIADILAISPISSESGKFNLAVIISESKYIDYPNLSQKRKESQKQLRDTITRIDDALFGDPERLDRDLWLSRFSDLLLTGIQFPATSPIDLSTWRKAVRSGDCGIYLRGYSHIFVFGQSDDEDYSEMTEVAETNHSFQEIYSRSRLRDLLLLYQTGSDPIALRKVIAEKDIWSKQVFIKPSDLSELVSILDIPEKPSGDETVPEIENDLGEDLAEDLRQGPEADQPISESAEPDNALINYDAWAFTGLSKLFNDHQVGKQTRTQDDEWLKQVESKCKGALQQFQLKSKLISKTLTPNSALLKFQGSSDLTVEQVSKRRSQFLTTHGLNIISIRAEPEIVAISIARQERQILHLPDVWADWSPKCQLGNHKLLVALKEEDSNPLFISPKSNAPHTLIAGSTGSGKSVLIQNIILGIACTNSVDQAKLIIIDPKLGVDYFAFEGLPHLEGGIIDQQEIAINKLNELVEEMDRRYQVLRSNKVSNIYDLNKKMDATEHLPFLWVIHDEFAEWMMVPEYSETVSNIVGRLGVKARAAGISLIFAAQRPDSRVMPMQLRANLGNRLVLRVDGEGTSEIALGEKGAENLLGNGHLAARLEGESDTIFAQVPLVENPLIEAIVSKITESAAQS